MAAAPDIERLSENQYYSAWVRYDDASMDIPAGTDATVIIRPRANLSPSYLEGNLLGGMQCSLEVETDEEVVLNLSASVWTDTNGKERFTTDAERRQTLGRFIADLLGYLNLLHDNPAAWLTKHG